MSLARQHRERTLALQTASAPASGSGLAPSPHPRRSPADQAAAQISMRLVHDLRRLKQIKSTEAKVAAKREMLPEYHAWCDGCLEAGRMTVGNELGTSAADDVLPTIMVWAIDTGDWPRALALAAHVLRFRLKLPDRYQRDAATLVVEEIAEAAITAQLASRPFPLDVLEQVEELTAGVDMHDEVQAKLQKAMGLELDRAAQALDEGGKPGNALALLCRSMVALQRAQELNPRAGAKTKLTQIKKAIDSTSKAATDQAGHAAG